MPVPAHAFVSSWEIWIYTFGWVRWISATHDALLGNWLYLVYIVVIVVTERILYSNDPIEIHGRNFHRCACGAWLAVTLCVFSMSVLFHAEYSLLEPLRKLGVFLRPVTQ